MCCSQLSPRRKNQWIKLKEFYGLVDFCIDVLKLAMVAVFIPLKSANTMNQPLCLFESWLVDLFVCTPLVFSSIRHILKKREVKQDSHQVQTRHSNARKFRQQESLLTVAERAGKVATGQTENCCTCQSARARSEARVWVLALSLTAVWPGRMTKSL